VTPVLNVDLARQTPDRNSIHVTGWTAQSNSPTTSLTVAVSVDGRNATTVTASVPRGDVAAAHPSYGPNHGYDVTVPASPIAHHVCVTAVHVGTDATSCRSIDAVVGFSATRISYDTAHAQITAANLDELDTVTNTNSTTVQQSTTITGQKQLTDTHGWSDTYGVQVTVNAGIDIPIFASFNVTVQGSASFTQNGSSSSQVTFTWQQPVIVPAKSQVVADVAVSRTTLVVPYTMYGNAVYASGAQAPHSISGTYSGINSHDLQVTLTQYNLDGTRAAKPIPQPAATLQQTS
jgi:Clostridium epsilon toxin ETX/Bacillus mosquitocidal toxin MTX2